MKHAIKLQSIKNDELEKLQQQPSVVRVDNYERILLDKFTNQLDNFIEVVELSPEAEGAQPEFYILNPFKRAKYKKEEKRFVASFLIPKELLPGLIDKQLIKVDTSINWRELTKAVALIDVSFMAKISKFIEGDEPQGDFASILLPLLLNAAYSIVYYHELIDNHRQVFNLGRRDPIPKQFQLAYVKSAVALAGKTLACFVAYRVGCAFAQHFLVAALGLTPYSWAAILVIALASGLAQGIAAGFTRLAVDKFSKEAIVPALKEFAIGFLSGTIVALIGFIPFASLLAPDLAYSVIHGMQTTLFHAKPVLAALYNQFVNLVSRTAVTVFNVVCFGLIATTALLAFRMTYQIDAFLGLSHKISDKVDERIKFYRPHAIRNRIEKNHIHFFKPLSIANKAEKMQLEPSSKLPFQRKVIC